MKVDRVLLNDLHGLQLFQTSLLGYLVLLGIFRQMPGISNVPDVTHLIAQVQQVPENHVEGHESSNVPEVHIAVNRGAADIHAHVARLDRFEDLFFVRQ